MITILSQVMFMNLHDVGVMALIQPLVCHLYTVVHVMLVSRGIYMHVISGRFSEDVI